MDHLYVKPEWRKSGIGQSLLFHLAQVAKEQGVGRINAWCIKANEQGQNFYRKIKAEKRDFVDIYSMQVANLLQT
jgi:GNAT superfamily N-acetyltransferase